MRLLVVLALVLTACRPTDRRDRVAANEAPSAATLRGPDPIVLRAPRGGGVVRAYAYPKLDSAIWQSEDQTPPIEHVLAFDQNAGSLAYVGRDGLARRVDLRAGTVSLASNARLAGITSADGWAIYGVANGGTVRRLTPSGDWTFAPPSPARAVIPRPDGSLIVVADEGGETTLLSMRPPETSIRGTVTLEHTRPAAEARVGDRIYFATADSALVGVQGRTMSAMPRLRLNDALVAMAPTPSGDRLYVATKSRPELAVLDRYTGSIATRITLPGKVADLRMDPLGRYLLAARAGADSAWVIAIGTDRLIGAVGTHWRPDLPMIAPDGQIALATGNDVTIVDGATLRASRRIAGGALDFWHLVFWTGFRPRAAALDAPVATADSNARKSDSTALAAGGSRPDSGGVPAPRADSAQPANRQPAATQPRGWLVSFAALLSEARAQEMATSIENRGQHARVVTTSNAGTAVYRVVLGPYATREDAERVGRDVGRSYWVYEDVP